MKMFPADIWEYPIPKIGNISFRFLGKTLDEIQMLMLAAFATVNRSVILGIVAVIFLIPVIIYQLQIMKNRHEAKMKEW